MAWNPYARPSLHPFIGFRQEREGGFVFNPYMMSELWLGEAEAAVVAMCDGRTPVGVMGVELARRFRTDRATADGRVDSTLARLREYFALRLEGPAAPSDERGPARDAPRQAPADCGSDAPSAGCLSAPLSILWEITHACNLACVHCLSACSQRHPQELTTDEALGLLDQLAALKVFWFTLGGGEPLVRPDVYDLMAHATRLNLCIRLTTNGYAVTPETMERLADVNVFSVQVSLDGMRATHDRLRGQPGAFDRALQALEAFREHGYMILVNTAASAANVEEIPELARLAARIGVTSMKVGPVVPLGRGAQNRDSLGLAPAQLKYLATQMREVESQVRNQMALQLDGLFCFLLEPEPQRRVPDDGVGPGCSAGVSQVVVTCDGEVYPCPYIRDLSVGSVRRQSLAEIWQSELLAPLRQLDRSRLKGKCGGCGYRPSLCTGGCRGAAYAATGDLYAEDPNCWRGA
jgi:radical SAM protein with 4Fe4S-binding SPASM domain